MAYMRCATIQRYNVGVFLVRGLGVSSKKKRERKNCVLAGERRQLWLFLVILFRSVY